MLRGDPGALSWVRRCPPGFEAATKAAVTSRRGRARARARARIVEYAGSQSAGTSMRVRPARTAIGRYILRGHAWMLPMWYRRELVGVPWGGAGILVAPGVLGAGAENGAPFSIVGSRTRRYWRGLARDLAASVGAEMRDLVVGGSGHSCTRHPLTGFASGRTLTGRGIRPWSWTNLLNVSIWLLRR